MFHNNTTQILLNQILIINKMSKVQSQGAGMSNRCNSSCKIYKDQNRLKVPLHLIKDRKKD